MNNYHIILEETLSPELNKKYLDELRKRGWIQSKVSVKCKKEEVYYLSITCSSEFLGKIVSFLLDRVDWLIIEQKSDKIINSKDCQDFESIIPF